MKDQPRHHIITKDTEIKIAKEFEKMGFNLQRQIPMAVALTQELMPDESVKDEILESGLPKNIEEFNDKIKFKITKMHEQCKIGIETKHENKLAKEIRDVYCQLSTIKNAQAVIMAQTNGILPATELGQQICTRLQGLGQAITLQQCEPQRN